MKTAGKHLVLNEYRPMTLTSVVINAQERRFQTSVMHHQRQTVPSPISYQADRSVDHAFSLALLFLIRHVEFSVSHTFCPDCRESVIVYPIS